LSPSSELTAGRVVRFQDGTPVAGAVVGFGGLTALSGADGRFVLEGPQLGSAAYLTVTAPGYVERAAWVAIPPAQIDVIENASPFDLEFYRQFARNAFDSPQNLRPLSPWTLDPSFYVKTLVEVGGEAVPADVLLEVERVIRGGVSELSGGRLTVAAFETGLEDRALVSGWVNVVFQEDVEGGIGRATAGGDQGRMWIEYVPEDNVVPLASHGCLKAVGIAMHEVVHTMGFSHTSQVDSDFYTNDRCASVGRSDRAVYHADVAYHRPRGNRDPDIDPLAPLAARSGDLISNGQTVICRR
jgi:hypothetical protein